MAAFLATVHSEGYTGSVIAICISSTGTFDFNPVSWDLQGEEDEDDGASEAASLEEPKEEDQGEGYLSEMDNEPPVSESDDGFSIHNAPLQSHTLADSIPSSPASSQL